MKFCGLIVTLLVIHTEFAHGVLPMQNSTIEFLFNLNDQPGDGYRIGYESPTFPSFARNAVKICVSGMWALYNFENYGIGSELTTSIAVQGDNTNDCTTSSVAEVIRTIRSLRPLVPDLKPTASPTCVHWMNKNFIGTSTPVLGDPAAPTTCTATVAGTKIGSLAFTATPAASFATIAGSKKCVCVDLTKGPFFISDGNLFPNAENAIGDITMIAAPAATCVPPPPATACSTISARTVNNVFRSYQYE